MVMPAYKNSMYWFWRRMTRYCLVLIIALTIGLCGADVSYAIGWIGYTLDGVPCAGKGQGYGPFDYTNPVHMKKKYPIVRRFHFTRQVELLQRGQSGTIEGDLDYTLRAFPNHHRALLSYIKYYFMKKKKLRIPPECYLNRAEAFKPDDPALYALHGYYLHRMKRYLEAKDKYFRAISLSQNNAEYHYNYGLLLFDMGKYDLAREHARIAESLGFPLHGLKRKLKRVEGGNDAGAD